MHRGWRLGIALLVIAALVTVERIASLRRSSRPPAAALRFQSAPQVFIGSDSTLEERALLKELVDEAAIAMPGVEPTFNAKAPSFFVYFVESRDLALYDQSLSKDAVVARRFEEKGAIAHARLVVLRDRKPSKAQLAAGFLYALGVSFPDAKDATTPTDLALQLRALYGESSVP
jgi:hypothetical protein